MNIWNSSPEAPIEALQEANAGQAAGGIRFWSYETLREMVTDGLRLSRAVGRRCALTGLGWGGGKGVIARRLGVDHRDPGVRRAIHTDYGHCLTSLAGCYVGGEDVGTTPEGPIWPEPGRQILESLVCRG